MMHDVISELSWRGLINQTTDDANLPRLLLEKPRTVYAGFDPTADSLHVGHLVALMVLRRFQKAGHRPIAVVGGATGMIGDPSGKSEERNLLSPESLRANIAGMEPQLRRFLDFDCGPNSAILVNNYDWTGKFSYLEFLRDVGKHFPVNVMLTKDSVRSPAGTHRRRPELHRVQLHAACRPTISSICSEHYGCELQVGGSDQWGNITAGIDLARRLRGVQLYGCTCPLLTKSDGRRWARPSRAPCGSRPKRPARTILPILDQPGRRRRGPLPAVLHRLGQRGNRLAAGRASGRSGPARGPAAVGRRVDRNWFMAPDGLRTAERATEIFFGAEISDLDDAQLAGIFADVPSQQLPRERLSGEGLPIIDALVESGLAKSKGDARRTITQGGAYVNNRRVEGIETRLTPADLASESTMILAFGQEELRVAAVCDDTIAQPVAANSRFDKEAHRMSRRTSGICSCTSPPGLPRWLPLVAAGAVLAVRHEPAFYREALEIDPAVLEKGSDRMLQQVAALQSAG